MKKSKWINKMKKNSKINMNMIKINLYYQVHLPLKIW